MIRSFLVDAFPLDLTPHLSKRGLPVLITVATNTIKTAGGNPRAEWYQNRHQTQDRIIEPGDDLGTVSTAFRILGLLRDTFTPPRKPSNKAYTDPWQLYPCMAAGATCNV
ncbi:MAG: hypothetical protein PVG67_11665 [Desulfobacterales bacterium]